MVHRIEHDVEGTGTFVSSREDAVPGSIKIPGAHTACRVTVGQHAQCAPFTDSSCLQDVCVFQTQAFGKVLVLDGKPCIHTAIAKVV